MKQLIMPAKTKDELLQENAELRQQMSQQSQAAGTSISSEWMMKEFMLMAKAKQEAAQAQLKAQEERGEGPDEDLAGGSLSPT